MAMRDDMIGRIAEQMALEGIATAELEKPLKLALAALAAQRKADRKAASDATKRKAAEDRERRDLKRRIAASKVALRCNCTELSNAGPPISFKSSKVGALTWEGGYDGFYRARHPELHAVRPVGRGGGREDVICYFLTDADAVQFKLVHGDDIPSLREVPVV